MAERAGPRAAGRPGSVVAALPWLLAAWLFLAAGCRAGPLSGTHAAATARTFTPAAPTPYASLGATAPPAASSPRFGGAPVGRTEEALVVRVVDGDTIVVRARGSEWRVRYIGIDAPESVRAGSPVEPLGRAATRANERLVDRANVVLQKDVSETDRYGRLLRYVWIRRDGGWLMVNEALVRTGFAYAVTYPPDVRYGELLREAEREAREEGRGLWAVPSAPP